LDLADFKNLLTDHGQEALQSAEERQPAEQDYMAHFDQLSRSFPPSLARAALETAILRLEAAGKFPFAEKMYFTREALEQATPYEVSTYRAQRYRGFQFAADLGCSIGGDTLALASVTRPVGLDLDELRLAMANKNLANVNPESRGSFLLSDLRSPLPLKRSSSNEVERALFFDPARRKEGRRAFSVRHYHPPLNVIENWLPNFQALGVKISPGVDLEELASYEAEIEFISLEGELKEAVLWFGPLKTAARRATVLPGPHTFPAVALPVERLGLSEPQSYLYEPDPSILRAGLVGPLGERLGATQLDSEIAYLTSPELKQSPFARAWKVEDWLPFNLKRLRAYLRERGVGKAVVKKRGSPLQPEALLKDLRLKGDLERVLVLTQVRGQHSVLVCLPEVIGYNPQDKTTGL
jgi:hypothetical protein